MSTATVPNPTEQLVGDIASSGHLFAIDIMNMSDDVLKSCPGGKARCGYDLIFEVVEFNEFVAKKAKGEEATMLAEGWVRAPDSFKNRDQAADAFKSSVVNLGDSLLAAPDDRMMEPVKTPFGELPLVALAKIAPRHMMYHSGQLNYIQTINGDDTFHWGG